MKYSALAAASLFVASSLGMPEIYSRAPGQIVVTNNMNRPIRMETSGAQPLIIHQGQTVQLQATKESEDVMLRAPNAPGTQAQVSYSRGDQGTYGFSVKPVGGGGFPGAIEVLPLSPRPSSLCHPLLWYPGQGNTPEARCQDRTPLRVFLREAHN
ncbi:hypothetical protein NLG97_g253 [Lecanicillium saksenae]|uniref:Uncharacterized protein n=1 Tax=Lecanicillium saksenae TaxID=468837 RepID=A0ACC1R9S2_9HYPO|nr:hypothetical protein NLG97_g253 [Lecanicillium saksenae]